jgi:hypothetical protein
MSLLKPRKRKKYKSSIQNHPDDYYKSTWLSKSDHEKISRIADLEQKTFKLTLHELITLGIELWGRTEITYEKLKRAGAELLNFLLKLEAAFG